MMDLMALQSHPIDNQPNLINTPENEPDPSGPSFDDYLQKADESQKPVEVSSSQENPAVNRENEVQQAQGSTKTTDTDQQKDQINQEAPKEKAVADQKEGKEENRNKLNKSGNNNHISGKPKGIDTLIPGGKSLTKKVLTENTPVTEIEDSIAADESELLLGQEASGIGENLEELSDDGTDQNVANLLAGEFLRAGDVAKEKVSSRSGGEKVELGQKGSLSRTALSGSNVKKIKIARTDTPNNGIEVEVSDMRKDRPATLNNLNQGRDNRNSQSAGNAVIPVDPSVEANLEGDTSNVRILEMGGDGAMRDSGTQLAQGTDTKAPAASFGEILKDKGITQLVKQTGILLKDDNHGEIKLILKPEALGKVRIRLNLEDNRIAGRIIVENSNVKDIFNQNLDELQRALRESGFDTAQLEVSVEGEASEQNQEQNREPLRNQRELAGAIEEALPRMEPLYGEEFRVNLIA